MNLFTCFPEGKFKVLTLSYDDGKEADRRLVGLLNRYGIRGTFHLNSGLFDTPGRIPREEIAPLYRGHEISAHTLTHPTIARSPREELVRQVMEDRRNLEAIAGYPVRGLSYPNGSYNRRIIEALPGMGIEYARTVNSTGTFALPENFLEWDPTCHHNHNLLERTEEFLALTKKQYLFMMYVWGHSYEFDNDGNWDMIESFCRLAGRRDDIWYATNQEIVDYFRVLDNLKFSADCSFVYNPSARDAWLARGDEVIPVPGGEQVSLI